MSVPPCSWFPARPLSRTGRAASQSVRPCCRFGRRFPGSREVEVTVRPERAAHTLPAEASVLPGGGASGRCRRRLLQPLRLLPGVLPWRATTGAGPGDSLASSSPASTLGTGLTSQIRSPLGLLPGPLGGSTLSRGVGGRGARRPVSPPWFCHRCEPSHGLS